MRQEDSLRLTPSRSRPRSEVVYQALIRAIRRGEIQPGERIREEDVADLLGVSRTPVREALQQLQAYKLVELVPGRGNVVVELSMQQAMEVFAMREVLEGAAARLAAQHAQPAEIAIMSELLITFEGAGTDDPSALADINQKLHRTIHQAAHNRYMQDTLAHLNDTLSLLPGSPFGLGRRADIAAQEHRAIVEAIASRDADGAEAAAKRHIREALAARMRMLSDG